MKPTRALRLLYLNQPGVDQVLNVKDLSQNQGAFLLSLWWPHAMINKKNNPLAYNTVSILRLYCFQQRSSEWFAPHPYFLWSLHHDCSAFRVTMWETNSFWMPTVYGDLSPCYYHRHNEEILTPFCSCENWGWERIGNDSHKWSVMINVDYQPHRTWNYLGDKLSGYLWGILPGISV